MCVIEHNRALISYIRLLHSSRMEKLLRIRPFSKAFDRYRMRRLPEKKWLGGTQPLCWKLGWRLQEVHAQWLDGGLQQPPKSHVQELVGDRVRKRRCSTHITLQLNTHQ